MNTLLRRIYFSAASTGMLVTGLARSAFAQQFGGELPALDGLKDEAGEGEIKTMVADVINIILNFLGLIAVIVIIIAGIRLIISQGEEEAKEKAKKTIFYALIGLVIVLFAKVIVGLVTNVLAE
jgi:amino acid transporter